MDIIEKLETYRLENKISQQQLAEKLGVAFSTVNRWLNGKSKPNKIQEYHIKKILSLRILKPPSAKKRSISETSKRRCSDK
ncbi:MAG: helix-turn-helix transcriptional regulator [Candidatus Zixiibacteriota bacterium]